MAFLTNSNRPQPLWQPLPTAGLTASGAASEVPCLLMHPCLRWAVEWSAEFLFKPPMCCSDLSWAYKAASASKRGRRVGNQEPQIPLRKSPKEFVCAHQLLSACLTTSAKPDLKIEMANGIALALHFHHLQRIHCAFCSPAVVPLGTALGHHKGVQCAQCTVCGVQRAPLQCAQRS